MALDTHIKNNVVGQLTLRDGTDTPVELVVPFYRGDLAITGLSATLNEIIPAEARGRTLGKMHGARIRPSVSFSAFVAEMTNASAGVLSDFLMRKGGHSANVSTLGAGRPYAIDIAVHLEGSSFGGNDCDFVLIDFTPSINYSTAIEGDSFEISGECESITGDLAASGVA